MTLEKAKELGKHLLSVMETTDDQITKIENAEYIFVNGFNRPNGDPPNVVYLDYKGNRYRLAKNGTNWRQM